MVLGYHIIFSTYGFWLPNDPRGSWSQFVGAWELFRAGGKATTTTEGRPVHRDPHDHAKRLKTKQYLKRPAVQFTGLQARAACRGFGEYVARSRLPIWACAILPDHVHMVTGGFFRIKMEPVVIQLKAAATRRLVEEGLHPFMNPAFPGIRPPKCWGRGEWKVFIDDPEHLATAIQYVEDNPAKDGMPQQKWSFVTPCPHV